MTKDVISFSVVPEDGQPSKHFELKAGADKAVRIGRAPGNDIAVKHRGVSQYHAELRFVPNSEGQSFLVCKDLSMNGTGVKKSSDKQCAALTKDIDAHVPDGAVIGVPMMLKDTLTPDERVWLKIEYGAAAAANGSSAKPKSATAPAARTTSTPPTKANVEKDKDEDPDEDAEKNRMQFVELLLKTKEIASGTKYEDAVKYLKDQSAWKALDEQTRRECFEIFVEYLDKPHKKDKKHDKKSKKEKQKDDEKTAPRKASPVASNASPEPARGKRRREKDRKQDTASPDRQRRSKRERRSQEKDGDRDRSRSGGRRDRRRRGA